MKTVTFRAWAIDTRSEEGHNLIGRYWWFDNQPPVIPKHMEGCQTALFRTRRLARYYLKDVRTQYGFPDAVPVHVLVTIRALQEAICT